MAKPGNDEPDDRDSRHRGPDHASPYPVSRLSGPISLVDTAREIERADTLIRAGTENELIAIADQIRALQERAHGVLDRARRDADLHRAKCNFQRIVGKTYHLYGKSDGTRFFSMLSPDDWGGTPPHEFLGSYRLEADQRWTPAEQASEYDRQRIELQEALAQKKLPGSE